MYYLRITKYNPKYRNSNDIYPGEEWASFSDIGNRFHDIELTFDTYSAIEDSYVDGVISIMNELDIKELKLTELEKYYYDKQFDNSNGNMKIIYDSIKEDMHISIDKIGLLIKLILREMIWGKLVSNNLFVHFGYDYYMYIGSSIPILKSKELIEKSGLFVENIKSPYLN